MGKSSSFTDLKDLSAAIVGLAYFINGLPFLLLTLHAGMLTDRFGARPLVAISFALTGMVMIAMGALALTTAVPLWLIIGLAFISGATMTLGAPGYVSIVNDLVPPGVVSSGVALNFLGISVGRIVGEHLQAAHRKLLSASSAAIIHSTASITRSASAMSAPQP